MTAVFCHNAADRKAETWKEQLDPFSRLEFAVSDAAKGIAAAVEQVTAGRHGEADAGAALEHGLDVFHTTMEAHRVLARNWRRAEAAWDEAEAADALVTRARQQGVDARGPAGPARTAWRKATACRSAPAGAGSRSPTSAPRAASSRSGTPTCPNSSSGGAAGWPRS